MFDSPGSASARNVFRSGGVGDENSVLGGGSGSGSGKGRNLFAADIKAKQASLASIGLAASGARSSIGGSGSGSAGASVGGRGGHAQYSSAGSGSGSGSGFASAGAKDKHAEHLHLPVPPGPERITKDWQGADSSRSETVLSDRFVAQRAQNGALHAPPQWGGAGESLASLSLSHGHGHDATSRHASFDLSSLSADESAALHLHGVEAIRESKALSGSASGSGGAGGSGGAAPMTEAEEQAALQSAARSAAALGLDFSQQILTFAPKAPGAGGSSAAAAALRNRRFVQAQQAAGGGGAGGASMAGRRKMSSKPDKVLDAADIADDFYYNLLDWSVKNQVAIALNHSAYIWDCEEAVVFELLDLSAEPERLGGGGDAVISSIRWHPEGTYLVVGTDAGYAQVWDTVERKRMRTLRPATDGGATATAVCALDWADASTLTLGYASGLVAEHDIRAADSKIRHLDAHAEKACGVLWRDDGALLATGGNDNIVKVYNRHSTEPLVTRTEHKAAIKAMSWSPFNANILATGGGSACRTVNIWNVDTNARLMSWGTEAQISSLHWSWYHRELLTTHGSADGSPSGSINTWSYPSGKNLHRIERAHEGRILGSVLSPDGQKLASVDTGANELRFWTVFEATEEQQKRHRQGKGAELYNPLEKDRAQSRSHALLR